MSESEATTNSEIESRLGSMNQKELIRNYHDDIKN